jgi:hypothetical protein
MISFFPLPKAKNAALLGKWLFKLFTEDGVWKNLLKKIGSKAISQIIW